MEFSTVGKREVKVDAKAKATGQARYVGDMHARHMLVGKVLRSPYAHAEIINIDTSKAEALDGVEAVLTYEDTPKIPFNFAGFPPSEAAILIEDQYIFSDKARFVGDPIAGVAAVDEETAEKALELIAVEYKELPTILDAKKALEEKEVLIHTDQKGPQEHIDGNICGKIPAVVGDPEKGFEEADYIFEDTYETQKVFQASMEPCGVSMAEVDPNGRIKIVTSTQMPHLVRKITAQALGMRIRDIQIVKPFIGGGFGSRLGVVNEPIAAILAKATNKPVKVAYDREESFFTESRHPTTITLKTGVKEDGTFTARQMEVLVDTGAYVTHGPSLTAVLTGWFLAMYKTPNLKSEGRTVHTNTPPAGAFRGYGNPQVAFAVESQVDKIAEELGIDPTEMRLKNHPCKDDVWLWSKMPIESCGLEECMERGMKAINWEEKRNREKDTGTKQRGVGLGYMMHVSGAAPELHENSSANVKINEDGSVNLTYACSDLGTGSATALSQICAETLGVNFEDVVITQDADTDVAGFDIGSHASRQTYAGGYAVEQAALEAKEGLLKMASKMMDCEPNDLDTKDGYVFKIEEPEERTSIADVSFEAHFGEDGHQIMGAASTEPPGNPPVYAVQFVEVEVDVETGKVDVLDFVATHDTGVAIHPPSVEGQIEGAIQQGMGFALTENMQYNDQGHPLNANFSDYKVLTSVDMPNMQPIVVEAASETGAFGAKSIGESGLVPTAPAIANAIYDAVGVRIKELPITPEKVLAALKEEDN
ncbi:MAG: xanthine dehydrogenase molybdenum-binding subunit [Candidatus Frackibacter sp. T328-2]|nr:MAG: xanthine dehydrogenase molybdenum-binding subunit [Candidatus Frackibacter sp. T328-2]